MIASPNIHIKIKAEDALIKEQPPLEKLLVKPDLHKVNIAAKKLKGYNADEFNSPMSAFIASSRY